MAISPSVDSVDTTPQTISDPSSASSTTRTVQQTADAIRRLAREVKLLSRQKVPQSRYFNEFLTRVLEALGAPSGVVWSIENATQLHLTAVAQRHLDGAMLEVGADSLHGQLLRQCVAAPGYQIVRPRVAGPDGIGGNPTDLVLLLVPLEVGGRIVGLVEVFQRAGRDEATERGYLRFLVQMGEHAQSYLVAGQLRQMGEQQQWAATVEDFLTAAHRSLRVQKTAYTVVNEARRVLGCDRVSLVLGAGRSGQVVAVSGLDHLDRRAVLVRQLRQLTSRALVMGRPIWLAAGPHELPPQVDTAWHKYVDVSHVQSCGIIPLRAPVVDVDNDSAPSSVAAPPLGALVIENIAEPAGDQVWQRQAASLAQHAAGGLANALEHESLFLLPVWRALGQVGQALAGRHFGMTLLATVSLVVLVLTLVGHRTRMIVPVGGTLVPAVRQTIFARQDGVIVDVPVQHAQEVLAGQVLVRMRNTDLEVQITSLAGKLTATREQILAVQRALLDGPRLGAEQQNRLAGELLELKQVAGSMEQQLALLRHKESELTIVAPHAGQVVTWEVRDNLLHRPVQRGQALLAVADATSGWELELYVPERHIGHVLGEDHRSDQLPVSFVLASHSDRTLHGKIIAIDDQAMVRPDTGRTIRVRVAIEDGSVPEMRSDTSVMARIDCGSASFGYAWFYDLIDTVRARLNFWFG